MKLEAFDASAEEVREQYNTRRFQPSAWALVSRHCLVRNMFPLVLGFAEVSRKRCEPKKGVVGVHATLGIGWVPGVGGPTRPPARSFSLFSRKIYAKVTI